MITGFNTNVRYGGRVFHVQTEDSGLKNPHVISHLYYGGTILSSEKRTYGELIEDQADPTQLIRDLMEEQHRKMLEALKVGEFDGVISDRLDGGGDATDPGAEPAAPEPDSEPAEAASGDAEDHEFGEGIVSDKPLDEVILEYLVDKARTRGGEPRTGRGNRSRE
jgi:hypothetical protein